MLCKLARRRRLREGPPAGSDAGAFAPALGAQLVLEPDGPSGHPGGLTARDLEILQLVVLAFSLPLGVLAWELAELWPGFRVLSHDDRVTSASRPPSLPVPRAGDSGRRRPPGVPHHGRAGGIA